MFTNDLTPRAKYPKGSDGRKRTIVREGASIGANATIVCGVEIGAWAMIAAGAVVVKDVLAHELVMGVPATGGGGLSVRREAGRRLALPGMRKSVSATLQRAGARP